MRIPFLSHFFSIISLLSISPLIMSFSVAQAQAQEISPTENSSLDNFINRINNLDTFGLDGNQKADFKLKDNFILTNFGFNIDKTCYDQNGKEEFINNIKSSLVEGMNCLKNINNFLGIPNLEKSGSIINLLKFQKMFDEKNVVLRCDEVEGYDWTNADAHATTSSGDKKYPHPLISLNPIDKIDLEFLTSTVFHELFHNIGYQHNFDVEYAYACSSCCFPQADSFLQDSENDGYIMLACKICNTKPDEKFSHEYIENIRLFYYNKKSFKTIFEHLLNYSNQITKLESPQHLESIASISTILSVSETLVGYYLIDLLKKIDGGKFYNRLSTSIENDEELNEFDSNTYFLINDTSKSLSEFENNYSDHQNLKEIKSVSSIIADSIFSLVKFRRYEDSVNVLIKNQLVIKNQLNLLKNNKSNFNNALVVKDLKFIIDKVLFYNLDKLGKNHAIYKKGWDFYFEALK